MNNIPVSSDRLAISFVNTVSRENEDGTPSVDKKTGLPRWRVRCLVLPIDDPMAKPDVLEVVVPSRDAPALGTLVPCQFLNLTARAWAMGDRSGISFSADDVRLLAPPPSNGRKPVESASAPS